MPTTDDHFVETLPLQVRCVDFLLDARADPNAVNKEEEVRACFVSWPSRRH